MILSIVIIILILLIGLITIYNVNIVEGFDGYYLVWYKKYDTANGIVNVKYSKRIKKFKNET